MRKLESKPDIRLRVDYDDPELAAYHGLKLGDSWDIVTGPRKPLSAIYNEFPPDWPWYGFIGDDVMPETPEWEDVMVSAAGSDGMAHPSDPAHFVLAGALVREMGWIALPGLDRIYIDTVWKDIAEARGVLRDVGPVLSHRHFSNGGAVMDATYRKRRNVEDRAVYKAWRRSFLSTMA
ncbi:MAG: hypothetical protein ACE5FS_03520 [Paracoccaceae bacterium]